MNQFDQSFMQVTVALMQTARAYKSAADILASDFELSQATAWPAVMIGRSEDGIRPGAVAEILGLEPSSMVRVIDQLIDSGLVERHDDPNDRRAKLLKLTAEGKKRVTKIEKALTPFRRKLLSGVSQADRDACLRVFQALNASIKEFEESRSV